MQINRLVFNSSFFCGYILRGYFRSRDYIDRVYDNSFVGSLLSKLKIKMRGYLRESFFGRISTLSGVIGTDLSAQSILCAFFMRMRTGRTFGLMRPGLSCVKDFIHRITQHLLSLTIIEIIRLGIVVICVNFFLTAVSIENLQPRCIWHKLAIVPVLLLGLLCFIRLGKYRGTSFVLCSYDIITKRRIK